MTRIRFEDTTPINKGNLDKLNNVVISSTEPTTGEEVWIQKSKNLFDADKANIGWLSRNGNELSFNSTVHYGEIRYNYDFEINKPYTFSFNILETSMVTYSTVLFFYTDGSYSENNIYDTGVGKYSITLTPTKKVSRSELRFFRLNNNTTQRTGKVTDIQIEHGEIATTYEPYIVNKIYTKNDNEGYEKFNIVDVVYPIGSIYLSVNDINPSTIFGGTWEQIKDRFLLGAGDTYANGLTGGEATHKLTVNEMPLHTHDLPSSDQYGKNYTPSSQYVLDTRSMYRIQTTTAMGKALVENTGGDQPHNNMPPYLTVYMWKRIK